MFLLSLSSGIYVDWKFTLLAMCLCKFYITENSGFWIFSQNALSQSDCRIIKLAISQEKNGVTMYLEIFLIWWVQSHMHTPAHMLLVWCV